MLPLTENDPYVSLSMESFIRLLDLIKPALIGSSRTNSAGGIQLIGVQAKVLKDCALLATCWSPSRKLFTAARVECFEMRGYLDQEGQRQRFQCVLRKDHLTLISHAIETARIDHYARTIGCYLRKAYDESQISLGRQGTMTLVSTQWNTYSFIEPAVLGEQTRPLRMEGEWPPVMPSEDAPSATLPVQELRNALERNVMTSDTCRIVFTPDSMTIHGSSENCRSIPAAMEQMSGISREVIVTVKELRDVLKALNGDVVITIDFDEQILRVQCRESKYNQAFDSIMYLPTSEDQKSLSEKTAKKNDEQPCAASVDPVLKPVRKRDRKKVGESARG